VRIIVVGGGEIDFELSRPSGRHHRADVSPAQGLAHRTRGCQHDARCWVQVGEVRRRRDA
jgi:hypothetical protein